MSSIIENLFPKLKNSSYQITSPATVYYNCIAWAFEDDENWWWPDKNQQYYWPSCAPREETINAFIIAFKSAGFVICDNVEFETGFIKIILYIDQNNKPTHASRQLPNGKWTSKLGRIQDIEHNLLDLTGNNSSEYGEIAIIMKKNIF